MELCDVKIATQPFSGLAHDRKEKISGNTYAALRAHGGFGEAAS